jgi:hypothetical protein
MLGEYKLCKHLCEICPSDTVAARYVPELAGASKPLEDDTELVSESTDSSLFVGRGRSPYKALILGSSISSQDRGRGKYTEVSTPTLGRPVITHRSLSRENRPHQMRANISFLTAVALRSSFRTCNPRLQPNLTAMPITTHDLHNTVS